MVGIMFMGSTVVTPLYGLYRQDFGFSGVVLTLIYSIYVVGNLIALLLFGRLSDQIGRRPVAALALIFAGLATILFLLARGTPMLFAARSLSGFAIGLGSGTAAAWLAELQPGSDAQAASRATSLSNLLGLAIGPLMAGLLAQYAPAPLRLSYVIYLAMVAVLALFVLRTPETVRARARWGGVSLKPRLGVPANIRLAFIAPATAAFAAFALVGFYAALLPTILSTVLHQANHAVGGAVVCELFAVAAAAVPLTRRLSSRAAMNGGLVAMLPGVGLLVAAEYAGSLALLLVAAAATGIAIALSYRGTLAIVNQIAPEDRRAEVVSTYYVVMFLGNSVPVIGVGLLEQPLGLNGASVAFAGLIALFALAALAAGAHFRPRD